jgi:glycosyltransferase involved in cell wall biosynthesis
VTTSAREPRISDRVHVLVPVFNDWEALRLLVAGLDSALLEAGIAADLVVVDDASDSCPLDRIVDQDLRAIGSITCLRLRRNLGHQRAIAIGLTWTTEHRNPPAVVVMDGDGEDDPRDVPRLIRRCEELGGTRVVFAQRTRRSEDAVFRVAYLFYRIVHRLLVGRDIRVGNFSVVPRECLQRLLVVSELWNHYAAAVFDARIPADEIPTTRGKRLHGEPRMNFVKLVTHGLSALSVYAEVVGTRLLIVSAGLIVLSVLGMAAVLVAHLTSTLAIPGWTSTMMAVLLAVLLNGIMGSLMFAFLILSVRSSMRFLPVRDYAHFLLEVRQPAPAPAPGGPRQVRAG